MSRIARNIGFERSAELRIGGQERRRHARFRRTFVRGEHIEAAYCQYRLRHLGLRKAARVAGVAGPLTAWLCCKLASMAVVWTKGD